MEVPFRPLGKVMEIASAAGYDVTYAFDDLVFSEHSLFILRFDKEKDNHLHLYLNCDCEEITAEAAKQSLFSAAKEQNLKLYDAGKFCLKPKEDCEEIDIEFI